MKKVYFQIIILFHFLTSYSQEVTLMNQFNGRYDFTFFGNTLNPNENGPGAPCSILTNSASTLTLDASDTIEAAYLYWAGSGTGDFDISLNGTAIAASRRFALTQPSSGLPFFSAFANITSQVQTTGNGLYTFADLDLTGVIPNYCGNGTNFGGWAIIVIYKNDALPLNQLNVYDGLESVPSVLNITLDNLNVIDNEDAKIGFLAWEGDRSIAVNETLRINGNIISNPPLNPADNAFNGTNSETGASNLYNMDLDVYGIQSNIAVGDTSATIELTSNQDFVMINAIVTKLNSQLPDATVLLNNFTQSCNSNNYELNFTVSNVNSTEILPAGTYLTFYTNTTAVAQFITPNPIPIGGSESFNISITIPSSITTHFQLVIKVDDNNGIASVNELNETNNTFTTTISPWLSPQTKPLVNYTVCNQGNGKGLFNLVMYLNTLLVSHTDTFQFFETENDAAFNQNPIPNPENYQTNLTPKTIFIKIENEHCFTITSFIIDTKGCPPVAYNHFTPNGDGINDSFIFEGLRDIFKNFKLEIYNRWGTLVWTGDNTTPDWNGFANQGTIIGSQPLPAGTYYYILNLNEPNFEKPITGWVFLNK